MKNKSRQDEVNAVLNSLRPYWRRWCTPGTMGCMCMGCFNLSERNLLEQANAKLDLPIKEVEFKIWAKLNPKKDITYD